ncbi:hypothetical protein Glove_365g142 [Diversispora epigaea]|uniref:Uncharacterized protein n=1 Tax=Diversispora epigaea TaxID=1348612 RepID=A0A397HC35_9GLOM|nr:hypothetical protein Glove_365g142 [Diversispora epigaea]
MDQAMYLITHKESAKTKIILCLGPGWICLNQKPLLFQKLYDSPVPLLPRFQNDMKNNNTANAVSTGGRGGQRNRAGRGVKGDRYSRGNRGGDSGNNWYYFRTAS